MTTLSTSKLIFGPELAGISLTPEEFDAIDEADQKYRYELINKRLIVTPPPLEAERDGNEELGFLLRLYRYHDPQGAALDDTLPEQTVVTLMNRRRADRVIWAGLGRPPDPRADLPSIVVEWVSERKSDWLRYYVEKLDEYRQIGIAEYWIFDRFRRTLTVYLPGDGDRARGNRRARRRDLPHGAPTGLRVAPGATVGQGRPLAMIFVRASDAVRGCHRVLRSAGHRARQDA